jgi:cystathionine gamma-synthase
MPGLPLPFNDTVGDTIPPDTSHVSRRVYLRIKIRQLIILWAVSVSLPTWQANVAYEEGEPWIVRKMKCGYPRYVLLSKSFNRTLM